MALAGVPLEISPSILIKAVCLPSTLDDLLFSGPKKEYSAAPKMSNQTIRQKVRQRRSLRLSFKLSSNNVSKAFFSQLVSLLIKSLS